MALLLITLLIALSTGFDDCLSNIQLFHMHHSANLYSNINVDSDWTLAPVLNKYFAVPGTVGNLRMCQTKGTKIMSLIFLCVTCPFYPKYSKMV